VIDHGKRNLLGIWIDALDYDAAVEKILQAAREGRSFGVSALAVHGVMTGVDDEEHRTRLNRLAMVTPDGQPVRWSLNWLYGTALPDRVYGPELTRRLLAAVAEEGLPVYFYGSTEDTVARMAAAVAETHPSIKIAGYEPSRFGKVSQEEMEEIRERIRSSGARILFVGLGCPRQEVFAYENADALSMPVLAVGAAFDYHAGTVDEPPAWIQRNGLQWLYRLVQDPKRLWRRYLILNPRFVARVVRQRFGRSGAATPEPVEPSWIGWA